MRKLASIRTCGGLSSIPKADFIEMAKVDGWKCVVGKGDFRDGELGVYFEIDSFLPSEDARYSKLSAHFREWEGRIGVKVSTITLKGQMSQGIFLPIGQFPELSGLGAGADVSELLGIVKWEPTIPDDMAALVFAAAPGIVPDTELVRVQNIQDVFELYGDLEFESTIKLNGMALSMYRSDMGEGVCSKRYSFIKNPESPPWALALKHGVHKALEAMGGYFAIQGELLGSWGTSRNFERVPQGVPEFHVFNIVNLETGERLFPEARMAFMAKLAELGCTLPHTPVKPGFQKLRDMASDVESLLKLAEGPTVLYPGGRLEGLVLNARSADVRFKVISNGYLLKAGADA